MRLHSPDGATRTGRKSERRIPRWLRPILETPLEAKLLGANLIIVGVALLLMVGPPFERQSSGPTAAFIVVAALILGATVNVWLVRLALAPLKSIERVAKWVSQGRFGERVPTSVVADHDLARLSRTINEMLDRLAADRVRIEKLGAELAHDEQEVSRGSRPWRGPSAEGITHGIFNSSDLG